MIAEHYIIDKKKSMSGNSHVFYTEQRGLCGFAFLFLFSLLKILPKVLYIYTSVIMLPGSREYMVKSL